MLEFRTAGESHGKCLIAIIEGFPAGILIDANEINKELKRRQGGFGRGARMQIEHDEVEILSGTRKGTSLGSPICLRIKNSDYSIDRLPALTNPRPGHADLAGVMKYNQTDARNILERASARETAARVAAGALAKIFLNFFSIEVLGYVKEIGGIKSRAILCEPEKMRRIRDRSKLYCLDRIAEKDMIEKIHNAKKDGDSVGGVFEVMVFDVPPGLGSYSQWNTRLDGRLAQTLMSIQAIKGVEIGLGFAVSKKFGSEVHDEIVYDAAEADVSISGGFQRLTNNAGGIEGGISNGQPIIVRAAMKPIPTLKKPLKSVDIVTKKPQTAAAERSDVCAVPAASVVGEAVVAFEIARAFLEKFGGDHILETSRNYEGYLNQVKSM
ncbi:MAG TPA: chorismate synthase [Candidatus Brocadiales bacterium]|nr:chorismate synthase [Candidatus Brocadiales bacterium]